jgi:hypothetical protein
MNIREANRVRACLDCGEPGAPLWRTTKGENPGRLVRICAACLRKDDWRRFGLVERQPIVGEAPTELVEGEQRLRRLGAEVLPQQVTNAVGLCPARQAKLDLEALKTAGAQARTVMANWPEWKRQVAAAVAVSLSSEPHLAAEPCRCPTRCDHDSQCTLSAGHGDRHETDHGCICYDPTRGAK